MRTVYFIYNFIFFLGLLAFVPVHFFRRKMDMPAFLQKCACYPRSLSKKLCGGRKTVWVHAVSVGEVILLQRLIRELSRETDVPVVISSTTLTGKRVAEKLYPGNAVVYFPFDLSFLVNRAVKILDPAVFVAVETEIWPVLYRRLYRGGTPVIILNGRISDRAFKKYRAFRFLFKKIFTYVSFVGVQTEFYRERFLSIGVPGARCAVTGNMKYAGTGVDQDSLRSFGAKYTSLMKSRGEPLLVAASTHPGEEDVVIDEYARLKRKVPHVKLLLAPRHIERAPALEAVCAAKGFSCSRVSRLSGPGDDAIYILDSMGELQFFYALADACFVGGSLVDHGGHNILEPLYFSVPTVFGPYMRNFREVRDRALSYGAAVEISGPGELSGALEKILTDKNRREELSAGAAKMFRDGEKIVEENKKIILQWLR